MNDLDDFTPLGWGLRAKAMKERFPDARISRGSVGVGRSALKNVPGDCGALQLCSANYATEESLHTLVKIASACGFSKIFATVVGAGDYIDKAKNAFKANRFKHVYSGYSNRNSHKEDHVYVKIIRNCEWKGYGGKG